jgi:hypothetical protein
MLSSDPQIVGDGNCRHCHHHSRRQREHSRMEHRPAVSILRGCRQHLCAHKDAGDAREQHDVWWAQNLNIEAVCPMPPIVKWRAGEHRKCAPDADPATNRPHEELPESHTVIPCSAPGPERVAQDPCATRHARDRAAQIDGHMCRRPERVATDGHVPRDIPDDANQDAGRASDDGKDVPGEGVSARRLAGGHVGRLQRRSGHGGSNEGARLSPCTIRQPTGACFRPSPEHRAGLMSPCARA